jgi:hypothetical protein
MPAMSTAEPVVRAQHRGPVDVADVDRAVVDHLGDRDAALARLAHRGHQRDRDGAAGRERARAAIVLVRDRDAGAEVAQAHLRVDRGRQPALAGVADVAAERVRDRGRVERAPALGLGDRRRGAGGGLVLVIDDVVSRGTARGRGRHDGADEGGDDERRAVSGHADGSRGGDDV